jgi:HK97 family phage portal protein
LITRLRGGGEVELRSFALTDMVRYGYSALRGTSGMGEKAIRGLPAIHRAARMRAEAIATLKLRCWRGEGPDRERVNNVWQSQLFEASPNEYQTRFVFWDAVGESLAYRNNAYIWKLTDPAIGRVIAMYALHPDQVKCKGAGQYLVKVTKGYLDPVGKGEGDYKVDSSTLLHIRGHGAGGTWEAPTPIEVFREALAGSVERQRHEARMWRKGVTLQAAVVFPPSMNRQQVEDWRESYKAAYEGTDGETTLALGGGADLKPIGMTMVDAQFVEMAKLTVHDASRIMGVPANLLGVQLERAVPNLEQDLATWFRFGLGPELGRIEVALGSDKQLFPGLGRSIYPAFDTDEFVRADMATEATILQTRVQAGIITPDEARHILGYPPLPNSVGKIPQITPVGGAPNNPPLVPAGSQNGKGD